MNGIKIKTGFYGLTQKRNNYKIAFSNFRKDTNTKVQDYGEMIYKELYNKAPFDSGKSGTHLRDAITPPSKYKISKSRVKITLDPFIPYWVFQEFGLKEPKWVVVDTKPALADWVDRHPEVKTISANFEDIGEVQLMQIGGPNTHLGTKNKFVRQARETLKDTHKYSFLLLVGGFRKSLPIS
jgi:hypothetical protein